MEDLYFYDSLQKQKRKFESLKSKEARIYVCGPTVYDDSHLGHARSAIAFDLLHRVLKANDYKVIMTKNFTDIDDKIINKMKESGQSLEEITTFYIKRYKNDMEVLNVLPNTLEPKATENLDIMIEMIEKLLKDKTAYILDDGVYFDTSKDSEYGSLSKRFDDENNQSRVEVHSQKKNQKDFALWKAQKPGEVSYEASFGTGRPGWHIECSAMINKLLAYKEDDNFQIDIHGGGADLLFPHHENEAAQTRCATGKNLAKYWMHNGFVNINGEKMSKSLGNSFFLKDIFQAYHGEVIRFYMITTQYRADFNFNEEDLLSSKKRLDKFYRIKKRVYGGAKSEVNKIFKAKMMDALNDDINTAKALSVVDELIGEANDTLDKEPKNKNFKKELLANIEFVNDTLGIGLQDAYEYFQFGISQEEVKNIEELITNRSSAKKEKNFELSDKFRDELTAMGISLMDTVNGTVWEKN
ncbi:cysteine--tRNA ligase [Arcobacter sp. 31_11_sub10_T18]|nr:cysteine--tRNA ligase [Arcobacter sp. 31_11_sub10_T18]